MAVATTKAPLSTVQLAVVPASKLALASSDVVPEANCPAKRRISVAQLSAFVVPPVATSVRSKRRPTAAVALGSVSGTSRYCQLPVGGVSVELALPISEPGEKL